MLSKPCPRFRRQLFVEGPQRGALFAVDLAVVDVDPPKRFSFHWCYAEPGRRGQSLLVTFGAAGARWGSNGVDGTPVRAEDIGDTVGAGDAFCGALAAALASGTDRQTALEAGNAAGAQAVRWSGAQPDAAL